MLSASLAGDRSMSCPSCGCVNKPGARGCRRCGKALPLLAPGDVVADRFEIRGLLGTGGMGVVFQAFDRTLEETVAVKTLRADIEPTDEMMSRLRSELRLARKVSSLNVCRIHEYGVDGALHYISMEYVEGVTVRDLLRESGALPVDVALDIAAQMMAGLVAIHEVGILHRDPKPANLMRTRAGLVKLLDFGIAKELGGVTLTAAGHAVGTPEYMSPEHVRGHKLDLRTDVYIAGIVVFELLTGISPFRGATRLEAAHKQVTEMPDLRTPGIPAALVPILGRALAKDRRERYSSARELADALAQVRDSLGREATAFRASLPRPAEPGRTRPATGHSQATAEPEVALELQALRGPDPFLRRQAVLALSELGSRSIEAVLALAGALKDGDRRVRFLAAAALGRLGTAAEPAMPGLIEALDDEAAGDEAAETLVKLGKPAVPTLLEVMRSGQVALRARAARTLTRIGAGLGQGPPRAHSESRILPR